MAEIQDGKDILCGDSRTTTLCYTLVLVVVETFGQFRQINVEDVGSVKVMIQMDVEMKEILRLESMDVVHVC